MNWTYNCFNVKYGLRQDYCREIKHYLVSDVLLSEQQVIFLIYAPANEKPMVWF
jgi:hypothetical protein